VTYVITEACANSKTAACVRVCPVDCIHPTPEEAAFQQFRQLYIDPQVCIDCGACVTECPVDAIYPDYKVPAAMEHSTAANAAHYRK
jgi:ferredoxin--NADP+ reductase